MSHPAFTAIYATLAYALGLVLCIGLFWLNDYKRGAFTDRDDYPCLQNPNRVFQIFSGAWLVGGNATVFLFSGYFKVTLQELLEALAIAEPVILVGALILPALIVGTYHCARTVKKASTYLAHATGRAFLMIIDAWASTMSRIFSARAPGDSERAR